MADQQSNNDDGQGANGGSDGPNVTPIIGSIAVSGDGPVITPIVGLAAKIVVSHVGNNTIGIGEIPELITSVHRALADITGPTPEPAPALKPAVPIRSSIKPDHVVCLEDGKKLKMLKRYLRTRFDMSPDDYRTKWGLPKDYPMVAPAYAEARRGLAKKIGLGRGKAKPAPAKPKAKRVAPTKPRRPPAPLK